MFIRNEAAVSPAQTVNLADQAEPSHARAASSAASGEAGIPNRLLEAEGPTSPAAVRRWILRLKFSRVDRARMSELALKGQEGALTRAEQAQAEGYRRVGLLLSLLKAKARKAVKNGRRRT